jgi:ATP-dependent DNA helicase RecG
VGPRRAKEFAGLGVHRVRDLLEYLPFRHELIPRSQAIGTLTYGVVATVVGELRNVRLASGSGGPGVISATVVDGTGRCRVRWFNSAYLGEKLHYGSVVRLTGTVEVDRELALLTNPQVTFIEDGDDPFATDRDRYQPVYSATSGLPSRQIAKVISGILDEAVELLGDPLPEAVRRRRRLPPRRTAVLRCHRPTSPEEVEVSRARLAYDELLACQIAVQLGRRNVDVGPPAKPIIMNERIDRRARARFPFGLTSGQDRAVGEITSDLARTRPMNRLLQADVGAGKTAVAVYSALAAIANRVQVALLAPTEVLAGQHRAKVDRYLEGSQVRVGYLVGSTAKSKRGGLLKGLASGEIDLLIGTHALLESDVRFRDLGLVIVDEQHKFGVAQRARLRSKGTAPHTLVLTATPIPRTLAMTLFGELDVSTIEGLPPGRQPVVTRLVTPERVADAWRFVRTRLDAGEQAYVVYPLVEESDSLPLKAATAEAERLGGRILSGYSVGLLHGRMRAGEKAAAMERFRSGDLQVLVATTVIEVGVDVPNATLMIVEHAERYGLSQLHQLRGRIGRGSRKSYCLLLSESSSEPSRERLRILCDTADGFRIAEEDLRLRGPGELLGTRQHGLPEFRVANLVSDVRLLENARDDAARILRADPDLSRREHAGLREDLARRYRGSLQYMTVG